MLIWQSQYDDNSNTEWYAQSCVADEFGDAYYWKLTQILLDNKIQWIENHDSDINDECPCHFDSLEEAKEYVEELDKNILAAGQAVSACGVDGRPTKNYVLRGGTRRNTKAKARAEESPSL